MIVRNTAVAALALLAAACGDETSCPTESPEVSQVADCTVRPGAAVSYPVQLCPTCNQTGATCDVDLSAANTTGDIFLDPKVEVCTPATSCPPTCEVAPFACTFDAPTAEGDYTVSVVNGASGAVVTRTLRVSPTEPVSCALTST